jgi:hypothetical protein
MIILTTTGIGSRFRRAEARRQVVDGSRAYLGLMRVAVTLERGPGTRTYLSAGDLDLPADALARLDAASAPDLGPSPLRHDEEHRRRLVSREARARAH